MRNAISENHNIKHGYEAAPFRRNREFKSLMNRFWNYFESGSGLDEATDTDWEPHIQVVENDEAVDITAELPGIDEKSLDLQISADGYLSLCGEKKNMCEVTEKGAYFSEISYGSFKRTVPLPWDLDYEKATAYYTAGVLNVNIPKSPQEKQKFKKIEIQTTEN